MMGGRTRIKGLTFVEILVAISIFGVLALSVSGLMFTSLDVRRGNQLDLKAQQFAQLIIERHKDYWSVKDNYAYAEGDAAGAYDVVPTYISDSSITNDFPGGITGVDVSYGCLASDGQDLSNSIPPLYCSLPNPPLRWVTVTLTDASGVVRTELKTEIGRPVEKEGG